MPIYEYSCACGLTVERFFLMKDARQSIKCRCGNDSIRIFSKSNINVDPHKWDLKPKRGNPSIMENHKMEIHFVDEPVDKDGRPVAEIPSVDPNIPKEEAIKSAPMIDNWEPPKGTVHPYDFVRDDRVAQDIRMSQIKKGT